ncbi:MAG: potassium channel family protein [Emergencia sp.]|jgi:voltage-gated potassium channel|uniref:Ion channel n=1 Tax=Anaerotruncus colihominis TaxID=169435 RepID=A0A845QJ54_9FIRM|nr:MULTISPECIES: potassium channel family protein [Anaerotruncus]MCI9475941.1 potassium channel family protein [Emergencia sp.]NBH61616.1 Ion channel [Anaerotruncus colihominis]NCF02271.1 Ion channel [Anaerotruncus sp. 80]
MYNFRDAMDGKSTKTYDLLVCIFCLASVALAILDFTQGLSQIEQWMDRIIYILFVADYIARLLISENKGQFFRANIIDLIAIIPLNSAFRGLRLVRMTKFLKLAKLARVGALSAKGAFKAKRFLNTNGFKYMICLSVIAVIASSCAMVYFEGMNLQDAVWWSFVTATTVGYGDLSPETAVGRIIASILMLVGIGLIGSLTSAITSFFLKAPTSDACKSEKVEMVLTLYETLSDREKELFRNRIS